MRNPPFWAPAISQPNNAEKGCFYRGLMIGMALGELWGA